MRKARQIKVWRAFLYIVSFFATKMIRKRNDYLDIILKKEESVRLDSLRKEISFKYAYLNNDDFYVLWQSHATLAKQISDDDKPQLIAWKT